ncbi:retinitis pigmentosa 1-like 1 protein [Eurosta solidaginis]|uniref:retinitis pigmentosa 1-like 1 protein n=1 Tax=Eurosta solidaginis TaxID=178769 RepID=UPI003530CD9B
MIFSTRADEQENVLCAECGRSTLPKCENMEDITLDNIIQCKESSCELAIFTDGETDNMCILNANNPHSQFPASKYTTVTTVLQVPLALQMVTIAADTAEAEVGGTEADMIGITTEQSQPETVTIETNEINEEPSADRKETSTENLSDSQPPESEQKSKQGEADTNVNTVTEESQPKVDEVEDLAQNAEQNKTEEATAEEKPAQEDKDPVKDSAEEVASVNGNTGPLAPSTGEEFEEIESIPTVVAVDVEQGSPDYPADAPALGDGKEEEVVNKLSKPVEVNESANEGHNAVPMAQQNTIDSQDKEVLDKNKKEISTGNMEPNSISGSEAKVTYNSDKPELVGDKAGGHLNGSVTQNSECDEGITTTNSAPTMANTSLQQILTCYSCASTTDTECSMGPGKPINCPAMVDKPNGCYTLYKADTNITTRGCISELTDAGLRYCQIKVKQCILCHEKNCNNLLAPSVATQGSPLASLWLGIGSFICLKLLS